MAKSQLESMPLVFFPVSFMNVVFIVLSSPLTRQAPLREDLKIAKEEQCPPSYSDLSAVEGKLTVGK